MFVCGAIVLWLLVVRREVVLYWIEFMVDVDGPAMMGEDGWREIW